MIREAYQNDFAEVSEVSQFSHQEGLQTHAFALSTGWHPLPFMQSLQLAFHRFCRSGDRRALQQKTPSATRF
jgi:hypothetical protein